MLVGLAPTTEQHAWFEYGGGQELMDKVYAKHGIKSIIGGNTGNQMGGWFKKEIDLTKSKIPSADLCLFLESMRIFKRPFDIASASCLNFFVASPKIGKLLGQVSAFKDYNSNNRAVLAQLKP
jgi:hypothetical protein